MKICNQCGNQNDDNLKICQQCGNSLETGGALSESGNSVFETKNPVYKNKKEFIKGEHRKMNRLIDGLLLFCLGSLFASLSFLFSADFVIISRFSYPCWAIIAAGCVWGLFSKKVVSVIASFVASVVLCILGIAGYLLLVATAIATGLCFIISRAWSRYAKYYELDYKNKKIEWILSGAMLILFGILVLTSGIFSYDIGQSSGTQYENKWADIKISELPNGYKAFAVGSSVMSKMDFDCGYLCKSSDTVFYIATAKKYGAAERTTGFEVSKQGTRTIAGKTYKYAEGKVSGKSCIVLGRAVGGIGVIEIVVMGNEEEFEDLLQCIEKY